MPTDDRLGTVLRFGGAALAATVIVFFLMIGALWIWGAFDRPDEQPPAHRVDLLSQGERLDLAEMLRPEGPPGPTGLPPLAEIPPLVVPEREAAGFVQVEFTVDESGRVSDAEVVRAMPAGVYEEQALAIVRSRRFEPAEQGPERRTEIVDFTLLPPEETGGPDRP